MIIKLTVIVLATTMCFLTLNLKCIEHINLLLILQFGSNLSYSHYLEYFFAGINLELQCQI